MKKYIVFFFLAAAVISFSGCDPNSTIPTNNPGQTLQLKIGQSAKIDDHTTIKPVKVSTNDEIQTKEKISVLLEIQKDNNPPNSYTVMKDLRFGRDLPVIAGDRMIFLTDVKPEPRPQDTTAIPDEKYIFTFTIKDLADLKKGQNNPISIHRNEPFELKMGQMAKLEEEDVAIIPASIIHDYRSVSDDYSIISENQEVIISLIVQKGNEAPKAFSLSNYQQGIYSEGGLAQDGDLNFFLKGITPKRTLRQKEIPEGDYTFTFKIQKTSDIRAEQETIKAKFVPPVEAAIDQTVKVEKRDFSITPIKVIQDTRCPEASSRTASILCSSTVVHDVKVLVTIKNKDGKETPLEVSFDPKSAIYENSSIVLKDTKPERIQEVNELGGKQDEGKINPIPPEDYMFTFKISDIAETPK